MNLRQYAELSAAYHRGWDSLAEMDTSGYRENLTDDEGEIDESAVEDALAAYERQIKRKLRRIERFLDAAPGSLPSKSLKSLRRLLSVR